MTTACAKRDGVLWHCYDRSRNETGGYTYLLKIREEYDDVTPGEDLERRKAHVNKKIKAMYPAAEPSASDLCPETRSGLRGTKIVENKTLYIKENKRLVMRVAAKQLQTASAAGRKLLLRYINRKVQEAYQREANLLFLGYKAEAKPDGVYMETPDRRTLLARWDKLREENEELPPLSIASRKEAADDTSFTLTYLSYDALLATEQFIHDNWLHVRPVLSMIQTPKTELQRDFAHAIQESGRSAYSYQRRKLEKLLAMGLTAISVFKQIAAKNPKTATSHQVVQQLEASLGALADSIFNIGHLNATLKFSSLTWDEGFLAVWHSPRWHDYLAKRFGDAMLSADQLVRILEEIKHHRPTLLSKN